MGCCGNCMYFSPKENKLFPGGKFFKDGYCTYLYEDWGDQHKAVNKGDSCDNFLPYPHGKDNGFKSSNSGCYLTSACVSYLGKADDCEELTKLRAFRDNYMKKSDKYSALVDEYYKVAPEIVKKIDESDKRDEYYSYIYDEVCRCIEFIDGDKKEEAVAEYKKMTEYLMGKLKLTKGL